MSHASLQKFLNTIQLEQSLTGNKIFDITAHKISPKIDKKYADLEKKINEIISDYENDVNELEYLHS